MMALAEVPGVALLLPTNLSTWGGMGWKATVPDVAHSSDLVSKVQGMQLAVKDAHLGGSRLPPKLDGRSCHRSYEFCCSRIGHFSDDIVPK